MASHILPIENSIQAPLQTELVTLNQLVDNVRKRKKKGGGDFLKGCMGTIGYFRSLSTSIGFHPEKVHTSPLMPSPSAEPSLFFIKQIRSSLDRLST